MRIRTVKPDFWPHRMHRTLSEPAALVALALLNYADDEGRFEADAEGIKGRLFTYRRLTKPVEECLAELAAQPIGWLVLYEATVNGEVMRIGQIVNFRRHQVINKPKSSTLPAPPPGLLPSRSGSSTGLLPSHSGEEGGSGAGGVTPSMEGRKGREGEEGVHSHSGAGGVSDPPRASSGDAAIPTLEEVRTWALGPVGVDPEYAASLWGRWNEKVRECWFDRYGNLVDWQRRFKRFWEADKEKWRSRRSDAGNSKNAAAERRSDRAGREMQERVTVPTR